jgi:hypothetical protein
MHRITRVILALLVATSALAGVVVAQDDTEDMTYLEQLQTPGDQGSDGFLPSLAEIAPQASQYLTAGNRFWEARVGDADTETATMYATTFQQTFNDHNDTLVAYANQRMTASTSYDVIRLEFHDLDGSEATRYLVADVTNSTYESARVVNSTTRDVDGTVSADWYVSRHATPELAAFITDYAAPDANVSLTWWTTTAAQYGSGWNTTFDETNTTTTSQRVAA